MTKNRKADTAMAGDWMKVEHSTPDKPEVLAIASELDISPDEAFAICFRMWRWFDQHTTDGNAIGVTPALLDRYLARTGFAHAALRVAWLESIENGLRQPHFDYHNGETAKQRALTAKRAKALRERRGSKSSNAKSHAKSNASSVTASSLLFSSLTSSVLDSGESVPESLRTEQFQKSWNDWVSHRSEIKKPLKPTQVAAQLKEMQAMGEGRAVAAIRHTISKGWQGLREPEQNGQHQKELFHGRQQQPTDPGHKYAGPGTVDANF